MRHGFSLVELSIVLVILGLLTGGVLSGQALIRASELQSIPKQLEGFVAADQQFVSKYYQTAGDMTNATQFWGSAGGTGVCSSCCSFLPTAIGTTRTCNGDNAGGVYFPTIIYGAGSNSTSYFLYWQQMKNAGFIEGGYTGIMNLSATPGTFFNPSNSPAGKRTNTYWQPRSNALEGVKMGFLFGKSATLLVGGNALTPTETWNLDTKIDDGMPNKGKMRGMFTTTNNCFTGTAATDTYMLTYDDPACHFHYYAR